MVSPEHFFLDIGISGRKAEKRPAFRDMIATAKSKEHPFDVILVWKFSRFARNQEESIVYKSLLERNSGLGAAIGVLLSVCVVTVFWICNHLLKDDDLEF